MSALPPDTGDDPNANLPEFSVSEISFHLKRIVEDAFPYVRVRGEISGFTEARSGHLYMALKDDKAVLDAVCWRGTVRSLGCRPEDGLEVVCTGKLTTYPGRSRYQLVIERMEPAGIGALMALLEERRRKLEAEGLFAEDRKRPLPFLPEVIGVVTSPTGAVIRDILHRLRDRFPRRVLIWPTLVQGEGAAEQIAAAIRGFNAFDGSGPAPRPDLLIVARGGGSIEDLWAFNEEVVVRAAAESEIPLISAVGHETDTTLIDHASDRRAPTPSAAAEMAVPVRRDLIDHVGELERRQRIALRRRLDEHRYRIEGLARGLRGPRELLAIASQRFDDIAERLPRALAALARDRRARLMELAALLRPRLLAAELRRGAERLADLAARARRAERVRRERIAERVAGLGQRLENLSYRNVLARGYAVARGTDGRALTTVAEATPGRAFRLEFHDGEVPATVDGKPARGSPTSGGRRRKPGVNQGELF